MTTNLGSSAIAGGPVGFQVEGNSQTTYERMKGKVDEELKRHFKPEFLNRVDDVIVFPQLNKDELRQIVGLFTKRLSERLLDRDMTVELTDAAKDRLIEIGFDPTLGARPCAAPCSARSRTSCPSGSCTASSTPVTTSRWMPRTASSCSSTVPRGEKVAVGVGAAGAIEATPDIVAGS
jgi:ATP-dependent Clp protease ATP-binding subunit ClpC